MLGANSQSIQAEECQTNSELPDILKLMSKLALTPVWLPTSEPVSRN